jgi:glycosyltransferase involved in cell wall biosynthesis
VTTRRESTRVLLAPMEIAGQMGLLARGLRTAGLEALSVSYYEQPVPTCDIDLGFVSGRRTVRRAFGTAAFAAWAAQHFDVFHFFFGESLVPGLRDLPLLRRLHKRVFVHFRGSDVLSREYARAVLDPRPDGAVGGTDLAPSTPEQRTRVERWRRWADALLVSTPDLLDLVPDARWVPQVIDLSDWPPPPDPPAGEEIVVAHAPRDPGAKGTRYVVEAVDRLRAEGLPIRLDLLTDRPHDEVRAAFGRCHIGVDQLLRGVYGNVAIELMASGRPVLANTQRMKSVGVDTPIVDASPATIADRLRDLVEDPQRRRRLGKEGREYAERRHGLDSVTGDLVELYAGAARR